MKNLEYIFKLEDKTIEDQGKVPKRFAEILRTSWTYPQKLGSIPNEHIKFFLHKTKQ